MTRPTWLKISLFLLLGLTAQISYASDTAKEKRWADQIVDSIMVGDAEWLTVDKQKILGIYSEHTTEKAHGGAIVLHGTGVHPNWPDVIHPLRTQLPDFGWHTLSVQMPILANDAKYEAYAPLYNEVNPRLDAAVAFLKSKGIKNIVLIAHSQGATMASYYLRTPRNDIKALVVIGMSGALAPDEKMNTVKSLQSISIPVLDIYGENDLEQVLNSNKARAKAASKAGNKSYTQIEVPGADHFFAKQADELVKRVRGWLKTNASGK